MINIDFLTLRAFFTENADFLIGARLQKIQQPERRDFILTLRNNAQSRKLYININPQIYHIAFMTPETEKRRCIKIPKQPPMFCMLLRKYLEGARVEDALTVEGERIFELHFSTVDELSQNRLLCLAFELMGKHSNAILYDRETMRIIGCAHNVGSEKSRYRELQGGLKYIYPPAGNIKLSNELESQFKNISEQQAEKYLQAETFRPAIYRDRYTLFEELLEGSIPCNSVNQMLDEYYSKIQQKYILKTEKAKLLEISNSKLKKTDNSLDKVSALLNKRDNTEKYKLYGELLTANIYKKCDYVKEIELDNYMNGEKIIIPLDETKTLSENASRYFRLYNKSKTTKEKSAQILENLNIEKEYSENLIYSIKKAETLEELEEIASEISAPEQKYEKRIKPLTPVKVCGFDVYIGKNNKQNEYIVTKLAKANDYWFHTKLCAGSHVLLRVNEKEPDNQVLFECCKLARENSSAVLPSKVGVIYTRAVNLRKPPKTPLGYVTYRNEKEVLV